MILIDLLCTINDYMIAKWEISIIHTSPTLFPISSLSFLTKTLIRQCSVFSSAFQLSFGVVWKSNALYCYNHVSYLTSYDGNFCHHATFIKMEAWWFNHLETRCNQEDGGRNFENSLGLLFCSQRKEKSSCSQIPRRYEAS